MLTKVTEIFQRGLKIIWRVRIFEKEAEEYAKQNNPAEYGVRATHFTVLNSFKDGAEFGYNRVNEWHFVKDGDLPEKGDADFIRILIVHHNHITIANYDGDWKSTAGHKISIPYAWKELPKPPREESELSEKNTK